MCKDIFQVFKKLKCIIKPNTRSKQMPIHTCSEVPFGVDALWIYVPNEEIDFGKYWYIKHLRIECYRDDGLRPGVSNDTCDIEYDQTYTKCSGTKCSGSGVCTYCSDAQDSEEEDPNPTEVPYVLPSLKQIFPRLEALIIKNMYDDHGNYPVYIKALTDIPSTVISLDIEYTLIENIGDIVMNSPNILFLQLRKNKFPNTLMHLPPNLIRLSTFCENFTNTIQVNKKLQYVHMISSHFPGIENLNPYSMKDIIIRGGEHPYNEQIFHSSYYCIEIIKHINLVNAHKVYIHYCSIPTRIRVSSEEELDNPIIVALHLASNYPRRMAEFMSYVS
jgi:hypothetical protein